MQRLLELPPINNVGSGQHAQVSNIDQGFVYDAFLLKLASTGASLTKSDLTNIRLRAGNKSLVEADGSQLDTVQKYLGRTADAEYLAIYFSDPNAPDVEGERAGALDTATRRYPSLSLDFDIGTATDPEITLYGVIGGPKPAGTEPFIRALRAAPQDIASAKEWVLQPDLGAGSRLARLHIFHANLIEFAVKQAGVDLVSRVPIGVLQYMQAELARALQSGHFCYERLLRDRSQNALRLYDNSGLPIPTQLRGTFSAADTIDMLAEVFTTWDRL